MITETVIGVGIDALVFIIASVINLVSSPISGTFSIPAPLFFIAEVSIFAVQSFYPALFLWYIWRQVKS